MTPSLRAALALAILMMRDRMTYRFAGFGTIVSMAASSQPRRILASTLKPISLFS